MNDDGVHNFLDLDNNVWTVRIQKNGTIKKFNVNPALCKSLPRGSWLLRKKDGEPFSKSARSLKYHKWSLESNNIMRKSYETWNAHKSGRSPEEKLKWNIILGHTKTTADDYYVKPKIHIHIKKRVPST